MTEAQATQSAPTGGPSPRVNELHLLLALVDDMDDVGLFVDVGAHIGSYSLEFAQRGWRVVAIEAAPDIHAELMARLAPYERVEVLHAAATETGGGDVEFFISSEYWGIHSLRAFHSTHDSSVQVPAVRIGDVLKDRQPYGALVIKVDTEGADLPVLRGMDWETERPRIVLCEFMDERTAPHFGYTYTDIIGFMEARGYVAFVSEWAPVAEPSRRGAGGGPFTHLQILRPPLLHAPAWGNLFFVSPADAPQFERVLNRYLVETRRRADELVAVGVKSLERVPHLEQSLVNRDATIDLLKRRLSNRDDSVSQKDAQIADLRRDVAHLRRETKERATRLDELRGTVARHQHRGRRNRRVIGLLTAACVALAVVAVLGWLR